MPYSLLRVRRVLLQSRWRRLNRPIRNSALALRSGRLPAVPARSAAGKPQLSPVEMPEVQHEPRKRHGSLIRRLTTYRAESTVDRKSTRLNSSHSQISYAVFCLKKKKKKKEINYE